MTKEQRSLSLVRKLWIGIGILAILSPLGLFLPRWFGAGGAWGEWNLDELRALLGFLPEGMEKSGKIWNAPLPGYAVPDRPVFFHEGIGYLLSALLGIAIVALAAVAVVRFLRRRSRQEK